MKSSISILLLTSLTLSACAASQSDFPSLGKRDFEDEPVMTDSEIPAAQAIFTLPPAIQAAVDAAAKQSNDAHKQFLQQLPAVQRRVAAARGAAPASENWVVAQMDMAALETRRTPSVTALADIDRLYIAQLDQEVENNQAGAAAIILEQREMIAAQVQQQQESMDAMMAALH